MRDARGIGGLQLSTFNTRFLSQNIIVAVPAFSYALSILIVQLLLLLLQLLLLLLLVLHSVKRATGRMRFNIVLFLIICFKAAVGSTSWRGYEEGIIQATRLLLYTMHTRM